MSRRYLGQSSALANIVNSVRGNRTTHETTFGEGRGIVLPPLGLPWYRERTAKG
jgi:hypothetical protein